MAIDDQIRVIDPERSTKIERHLCELVPDCQGSPAVARSNERTDSTVGVSRRHRRRVDKHHSTHVQMGRGGFAVEECRASSPPIRSISPLVLRPWTWILGQVPLTIELADPRYPHDHLGHPKRRPIVAKVTIRLVPYRAEGPPPVLSGATQPHRAVQPSHRLFAHSPPRPQPRHLQAL